MAPNRYNRRENRRRANIFKSWDQEAEDRMQSEGMEEAEMAERAAAALAEQEKAYFHHAVETIVKPVPNMPAVKDNKRKRSSVKVVVKELHKVAVVIPQVKKVAATPVDSKENNAAAALKDPMMVAATPVDSKENNAAAALKDPMMVAATPVDDKKTNAAAGLKDPTMVAATHNKDTNAAATLKDLQVNPTTECLRLIFDLYQDDSDSK